MTRKRVDVTSTDYQPGDPARLIVGRDEPREIPVRRELPKPARTYRHIIADILLRIQELEPLVDEYEQLTRIHERLKRVLSEQR
jgi:hypothetical protein